MISTFPYSPPSWSKLNIVALICRPELLEIPLLLNNSVDFCGGKVTFLFATKFFNPKELMKLQSNIVLKGGGEISRRLENIDPVFQQYWQALQVWFKAKSAMDH